MMAFLFAENDAYRFHFSVLSSCPVDYIEI